MSRALGDVQENLVALTIPKFEIESQRELAETLAKMGMPNAFDRDTADFSGMDGPVVSRRGRRVSVHQDRRSQGVRVGGRRGHWRPAGSRIGRPGT